LERRLFSAPDLELRIGAAAAINSAGQLVGHAAVFNQVTQIGAHAERIAPGAFKASIRSDDIRALFNHNPTFLLGRNKAGTLNLNEDDQGLAVEILLPLTSVARDLAASIKRSDVTGMSIGFDVLDESWERAGAGAMVRVLKRLKLYDVGPVTFPAYTGTDVGVASQQNRIDLLLRRQKLLELELLIQQNEG
jgi:HK97 family phage prohead protease